MALWEDGLKSFDLLLKGVQASHLGERTRLACPKFFGDACSKNTATRKKHDVPDDYPTKWRPRLTTSASLVLFRLPPSQMPALCRSNAHDVLPVQLSAIKRVAAFKSKADGHITQKLDKQNSFIRVANIWNRNIAVLNILGIRFSYLCAGTVRKTDSFSWSRKSVYFTVGSIIIYHLAVSSLLHGVSDIWNVWIFKIEYFNEYFEEHEFKANCFTS